MIDSDQIVLLDFDGVLCNTIDESMIVSYNCYFNENNEQISTILATAREYFYKHRWRIRPAGEYFVLWKAFETGSELNSVSFQVMKNEYSQQMAKFQHLFYQGRESLKKDYKNWLSLHRTYDNIHTFMYEAKQEFFVVTNKDLDSVESLAKYFGYYELIRGIYSMEISTSKRVLVQKLISDNDYDEKRARFIFVDDSAENLNEIADMRINVKTFLADWGYFGDITHDSHERISSLDILL